MEERWNEIKSIWRKNRLIFIFSVGSLMFLAGFIIGTASYTSQPDWLSNFSENFWTEVLGIIVTVVVIDRIYAMNSLRDRKILLFNQLKSHANSVAIDALEQIRREDWLEEALTYHYDKKEDRVSLRRLEIQQGNLNGVELSNVDFRTSKLFKTDLRNAKLLGCDLAFSQVKCAFLGNTDLRGCDLYEIKGMFNVAVKSEFIILPDGTQWQSSEDWERFVDSNHDLYLVTRAKINDVRRDDLCLPPLK